MNRSLFNVFVIFFLVFSFTSILYAQQPETQPAENAQTQPQTQPAVQKQYPPTIEGLKAQIADLKADYEQRIKSLEDQVQQLQVQGLQAPEAEGQAPAPQQVQSIPGALNPAISVAANFVGRADNQTVLNEDAKEISNRLNLREAELDLRVPVDPYADAVLISTLESETPGEFAADVEEGYVNIKKLPFQDQPPLGLKLKVGRFRPEFGKMNVLHTHDQPQTFRPLPLQEFLGEDGFIGTGIAANFFLPTPWDAESNIDATVDLLTSGHIAESPDGAAPVSFLGHLRWFRTFANVNNFELGYSAYYNPRRGDAPSTDIHGVDFLYRWKPYRMGEWKSYLLGAELYLARHSFPEAEEAPEVQAAIDLQGLQPAEGKPVGLTLWNQWQFDRRIYAGVRYDRTDTLFNPNLIRQSITPYISYYFSEFLRFRMDYEHRWSDLITEDGRNSLYFELNWIFGSHPPEPFWVNK